MVLLSGRNGQRRSNERKKGRKGNAHLPLAVNLQHLVDGIREQQRDEDEGDLETEEELRVERFVSLLHASGGWRVENGLWRRCLEAGNQVSERVGRSGEKERTRFGNRLEQRTPPGEGKRDLRREN
jgi:hypothetical protein